MKSLLISLLLVCALSVIMWRTYFKTDTSAPTGADATPSPQFMERCLAVSGAVKAPDAYCRCLWGKGIKEVAQTLTSPAGRTAASECMASQPGAAAPGAAPGVIPPGTPSVHYPAPRVPSIPHRPEAPPPTPQ